MDRESGIAWLVRRVQRLWKKEEATETLMLRLLPDEASAAAESALLCLDRVTLGEQLSTSMQHRLEAKVQLCPT